MVDMLDFSAEFWEDMLDNEPGKDDIYSSKKGISYATNHYCGLDPVVCGLQTSPSENGIQVSTIGTSKNRRKRGTKTKNRKHHPATG